MGFCAFCSFCIVSWTLVSEVRGRQTLADPSFGAMLLPNLSPVALQPESKGFGAKKEAPKPKEPTAAGTAMKQVVEDVPEDFGDEELFVETKPSIGELVVPIIGTFFVIGIPPLMVGLVRQVCCARPGQREESQGLFQPNKFLWGWYPGCLAQRGGYCRALYMDAQAIHASGGVMISC